MAVSALCLFGMSALSLYNDNKPSWGGAVLAVVMLTVLLGSLAIENSLQKGTREGGDTKK